ncbi:hypothetical protein GEMRC1_004613 [Eukaryota sp. GEM-RC1]
MQINSLDLTTEELSAIAEQSTFLNEIRYVERIIFELVKSVFDLHEYFSDFVSFDYDSSLETNFFRTQLEHPHIDYWYSTPERDTERLSPMERVIIGRNLVVDSRRLGVFEQLMIAIDHSAQIIANQRLENVLSLTDQFSIEFTIVVFAIAIIATLCLIYFLLFWKSYSKLRFCRVLIAICFIVTFSLLVISIFLSIQNIPLASKLNQDANVSLEVYDPIVSAQYAFNTIRRYFQIVQVSGSFFHTNILFSRITEFESILTELSQDSLCEHTEFKSVCELLLPIVDSIREIWTSYLYWGSVSTKLGLYALNDGVYPGFGLENVTWNVAEDPDSIELARPYFLTKEEEDLQGDCELKLNLSMAITSSRQFDQMSIDIGNLIEKMRDDSFDEIYGIIHIDFTAIQESFQLIALILVALIGLIIVISVLFSTSATPKREEKVTRKTKNKGRSS